MFKNKSVLINAAIIILVLIVVVGAFILVQFKYKGQPEDAGTDLTGGHDAPSGLQINENDHVWGDKNAPVKIVIYDDFECPFCYRFYETTEQLKQEFAGKIAIVFRHNPLKSHLNAFSAAIASECAADQGKFWEMYDRLFQDNKNNTMEREQYIVDAGELGLDQDEFTDCIDSNKHYDLIASQQVEGKRLGANGTPTFFVNGIIYAGAYPLEDYTNQAGNRVYGMRNIISNALAEK